MHRRPRRKPINKLGKFKKARWYFGRGFPIRAIAEKLEVSPTTIYKWLSLMDHSHTTKQLTKRILRLPPHQQDQIATAIRDARKAT